MTPDLDRLLARIEELVVLESPTGDVSAVDAVADVLQAWWSDLGEVDRHPSEMGDHLTLTVPGRDSGARVLLIGHHDTVWPIGTLDSMPWSVVDGVARGPGCYDMKSGLVIITEVLQRLAADGAAHPAITVVSVADEEVGSPTSSALVRELATSASAALGFESPHPGGALKRGRHGSTRLEVAVLGRAAHAALDPESGVSATDELLDQLLVIRRICDRPGVLHNLGSLAAPGRTNVVSDAASALIGLRFAAADVEDAVLSELTALSPIRAGADLKVEIRSRRPAWTPAASDTLLEAHSRIAIELGLDATPRVAAGAADTNTVGHAGVPTLDGLGPWGGGAHAASEHLEVAALLPRVELVGGLLRALA